MAAYYVDTWVSSKTPLYMTAAIRPGYSVKISNGIERYIVNVEEADGEYVVGTIANSPPHAHRVRIPRQCILKAYTNTFEPRDDIKITMMPMIYDMLDSGVPTGLVKSFLQGFHPRYAVNAQNDDMRIVGDAFS
jgi:hypothetical protein